MRQSPAESRMQGLIYTLLAYMYLESYVYMYFLAILLFSLSFRHVHYTATLLFDISFVWLETTACRRLWKEVKWTSVRLLHEFSIVWDVFVYFFVDGLRRIHNVTCCVSAIVLYTSSRRSRIV